MQPASSFFFLFCVAISIVTALCNLTVYPDLACACSFFVLVYMSLVWCLSLNPKKTCIVETAVFVVVYRRGHFPRYFLCLLLQSWPYACTYDGSQTVVFLRPKTSIDFRVIHLAVVI